MDFRIFLKKNLKTLLVPAILLVVMSGYMQEMFFTASVDLQPIVELPKWLTIGGPWFVVTLFWAKMIYWGLARLKWRNQLMLIVGLYVLGLALNVLDVVPNYWRHRHVLLMLPYLFIGHYCRIYQGVTDRWLKPLAIFGLVSILTQYAFSLATGLYSIPVQDVNISINRFFYIHIVNAVTGSAFIIWVSKKIGQNGILETLGKGTLLIYLWNHLVDQLFLQFYPSLSTDSIFLCMAYHVTIYIMMLVTFYILIRLIYSNKYLSWIVGKW